MAEKNAKKSFQKILDKAASSLEVARQNCENGYWDFAVSRAYYAAFYAVQAALLTKELSFSKHSSTLGAFNRHFVKTGIFPKEFTKSLNRLFQNRQIGDYDFEPIITERDAVCDIEKAQEILDAIRNLLIREGFL